MRANASRAILAGFVATLAMTMMMYAVPMMGMPKMDIAAMLGSMFSGGQMPEPMSGTWWTGMIIHFINGTIIFALIYAYLLYSLLPGSGWAKGLIWGLLLWFLVLLSVSSSGVKQARSDAAPNPAA